MERQYTPIGQATLILDAEVTSVVQEKWENVIFVDVELLAMGSSCSLLQAKAYFCFDKVDGRAALEELLSQCRPGSCLRVKTHVFSINEERLDLSSVELTPLDGFESHLLREKLRELMPPPSTGDDQDCPLDTE